MRQDALDVAEGSFSLPADYATHRVAMLAKPRVGKSNAAVRVAEEFTDAGIPWVAIDPKGDWWGVRSSADGAGPGLAVPIFGGLHGDVPLEPGAGKVIGELIAEKRLSCVLDVSQFRSRQEMWGFLIDLGETLLRRNSEVLHIFLDECDEYLPQKHAEGGNQPKALSTWSRVVSKGGQKGIGVTLISQRSAFVNKDVLWLVDAMIAFNTFSPKDRATIAEWLADKGADRQAFETALRSLAKGTAYVYGPDWLNDEPELVQFQRRTTFDSGATPEVGKSTITPATVADIDLASLGATIRATVERALADDPKTLQRRIVELERGQSAARDEVVSSWATEANALRDQVRALTLRNEALQGLLARVPDELEAYAAEMSADLQVRATAIRAELGKWCEEPAIPSVAESERRAPRAQGSSPVAAAVETPATSSDHARRTDSPTDMSKAERALLAVLVQFPAGRSKAQLSVLSGYSVKSSSFANALGALRSKGLIGRGEPIVATDEGHDAIPTPEPLPSGRELLDWWMPKLGKAEQAFLRVVYEAYPIELGKAELSERTGYSATSSSFANALGRLRGLELVEGTRCAEVFFERQVAA